MADFLTKTTIASLLDAAGRHPKRSLGQNFVADPNTVRKIAKLAGVGPGDLVLEIGAGLGSLTLALVEAGATVVAIEIDRHLIPQLRSVVEPQGAKVIEADAMKVNWGEFRDRHLADLESGAADWDAGQTLHPQGIGGRRGPTDWKMVANLPYNIATPLVITLLESAPWIGEMLIMVQMEVAERLAAKPRTKAFGSVSLKVAYWAEAKVVGKVSPEVFVPKPNVNSGLLSIRRRSIQPGVRPSGDGSAQSSEQGSGVTYEELFSLVKAGFASRRKMLKGLVGERLEPGSFESSEISESARAEELSLSDWLRLAQHLKSVHGS